jgi:hypothetical protein
VGLEGFTGQLRFSQVAEVWKGLWVQAALGELPGFARAGYPRPHPA